MNASDEYFLSHPMHTTGSMRYRYIVKPNTVYSIINNEYNLRRNIYFDLMTGKLLLGTFTQDAISYDEFSKTCTLMYRELDNDIIEVDINGIPTIQLNKAPTDVVVRRGS